MSFGVNTTYGFGSSGSGSGPITGYVPYIGADQNVQLGEHGLSTDFIQFSTTPVTEALAAMMLWNAADGTVNLGMGANNTQLAIGQATYYPPVVNNDSVTLSPGVVVMVDPAAKASGGRINVVRAVADGTYASSAMIGIMSQPIDQGDEGFATWFGYVRNLSLSALQPGGQVWAEGDLLYINPAVAGGMTKVVPAAPNLKVPVAYITRIAVDALDIMMRPTLTQGINELNNVSTTALPATNDVLYRNAGGYWANASISTIIGGTPVKGSGTTNYVPKFTAASTIGDSNINDSGTALGFFTATGAYKNTFNGHVGIYNGSMDINYTNGNYLFNVRSIGSPWALVVDPSAEAVGVFTRNPVARLHVDGSGYSGTAGYFYAQDGQFPLQIYGLTRPMIVYAGPTTNLFGLHNADGDFWHINSSSFSGQPVQILYGNGDLGILGSGCFGANSSGLPVIASAVLAANSTTKGFLPPRMTGTQAEAIAAPAEALMVYATDGSGVTITSKGWWGWDGATWIKLG